MNLQRLSIAPIAILVAAGTGFVIFPAMVGRSHAQVTPTQADPKVTQQNASLTIVVVMDGEPVKGAIVELSRGADEHDPPRSFSQGPTSDRDSSLETNSDAEGIATFPRIAPGIWNITVTKFHVHAGADVKEEHESDDITLMGKASRIIVPRLSVSRFKIAVHPQFHSIHVHILDPAGIPPFERDVWMAMAYGTHLPTGVLWSVDEDGNLECKLSALGLCTLTPYFRQKPQPDFVPISSEPCYGCSLVYALSPIVSQHPNVIIHGLLRRPGSIAVKLEDAMGAPLPGTLAVGSATQAKAVKPVAAVSSPGELVIPDLVSDDYKVVPQSPALKRPPPIDKDHAPSDAELQGVSLFAPQHVTVRANRVAHVTFRAEAQGYVRGRLNAPGNLVNYTFYAYGDDAQVGQMRINFKTGEFLAGPFGKGNAAVWFVNERAGERWLAHIPTVPGGATHVDVSLQGVAGYNHIWMKDAASITATRVPMVQGTMLNGSVTLADGATPARGASVTLIDRESGQQIASTKTGPSGNIVPAICDGYLPILVALKKREYVVVASIPGVTGKVAVPYDPDQPLRLVLPGELVAHGHVTVAGTEPVRLNSSFRILAKRTDADVLGGELDVEAPVQADGSFDLACLAPGIYRVQASMDDIWTSETQTVTVESGRILDMHFDIPAAGNPVDLQIVDADGHPAAGATLAISHPDGPETDRLWPKTFTADAAGHLYVEGLCAGEQTIVLLGDRDDSADKPLATFTVDIPALTPGSPATEKRLVCATLTADQK